MTDQNISFHEATVLDLVKEGDTVRVDLEGVTVGDRVTNAVVFVYGVTTITVDDRAASTLEKELDDGEVLTLDTGQDQIDLIVEWNDFRNRISKTRAYEIRGNAVHVAIRDQCAP